MLIQNSQLIQQLNKHHKFYFLFGAESLLIQQSNTILQNNLKQLGFTEKKVFDIELKSNWSNLNNELVANDLFISKRIIQINIINSNSAIIKQISNLENKIKDNDAVIIIMSNLSPQQQKAKWFLNITNSALAISHIKIYPNQMLNWVKNQMQNIGLKENDQIAKLVTKNNISNLLSANNELQKLKFIFADKEINPDEYLKQIKQQSIYNVYNLIDSALSGDSAEVIKIYTQSTLDNFHIINMLYIQLKQLLTISIKLTKKVNLTTALRESGIWQNKDKIISNVIKRQNYTALQKITLKLGRIERAAKGIENINIDNALLSVLLDLSGVKNGIN